MTENVAIGITIPFYNTNPPFHPHIPYPELPFSEFSANLNLPYHLLRDLLHNLGYDSQNFGKKEWNPFGSFIKPEQTVLIKPNFVQHYNASGGDLFAVITHPSILRAIIDYCFIALKGIGRIIIADAPQMNCNWKQLMEALKLDTIQEFYHSKFNFNIEIYDLRNFFLIDPQQPAYSKNRERSLGDPLGSVIVNLGQLSSFYGLPSENYYGADYDRNETISHHHGETHEYCVSKTILSADVFISVPKMKVHKKVGITMNLKGLVGINTNKNYLIHYRLGLPNKGGDQYPHGQKIADNFVINMQRWLFDKALAKQTQWGDLAYKIALKVYRMFISPVRKVSVSTIIHDSGNWYGNDTTWRMTADLAKILFFADSKGKLHNSLQRSIFCVVDGIVGGENDGPLAPEVKPCGCLVIGKNPFVVDMVATRLMGFSIRKIRQFDLIFNKNWNFSINSLSDIEVLLCGNKIKGESFFDPSWRDPIFCFKPHPAWIGNIEI